jgi:hypothetical protein
MIEKERRSKMEYDPEVETEIDRLDAERAEYPDGEIPLERMERGFLAAEARMRNRDSLRTDRESSV